MKLTDLTPAEQAAVLRTIVTCLHARVRYFQIASELASGIQSGYGTTVMNSTDRLLNRLVCDLVDTEYGIPAHDSEALAFVSGVLECGNIIPL